MRPALRRRLVTTPSHPTYFYHHRPHWDAHRRFDDDPDIVVLQAPEDNSKIAYAVIAVVAMGILMMVYASK